MHPITTSIACLGLAITCSAQSSKNWTQIKPAVSPSGRFVHAMAYDSVRKRTVLFGGRDQFKLFADTWEWDGKNWTQSKPSTSPLGRSRHAMAYDSARGRTVIFGGRSPSSTTLSDTWEWDGKNWTELKPTATPPARSAHGMVYDSARGRIVLFGGDISWNWLRTVWWGVTGGQVEASR